MKSILVCGAGNMGESIVHYFLSRTTMHVVLMDKKTESLAFIRGKYNNIEERLTILNCTTHDEPILSILSDIKAVIMAMPWKSTFSLIKEINSACIPIVSITRPAYNNMAELKRITDLSSAPIVVGCGLEPGLTEIFAKHLVSFSDGIEILNIYCGGVSTEVNPPLYYKQVFGESLSLQYRDTYKVESGHLVKVKRFSESEYLHIEGLGILEAYHDGMVPWLYKTLGDKAPSTINQKTLRWPGYANMVNTLHELGFLEDTPLANTKEALSPYAITQKILKPHAYFNKESDRDIVALKVEGISDSGISSSITLKVKYHIHDQLTAMACATGYTAAIIALMLCAEKKQGLLFPHDIISEANYSSFINELKNCNFYLSESLKQN